MFPRSGVVAMNRAQSNEPDQLVSSTVSITVLSVTPARAKKLFAFASVEIDGVQIGVHGIRVMREDGGTAIELPKFRDTGGAWRAAITLPQEVHSPIAKAVFDEFVERGLAVRRLGAMTADCPGPG
jgi:DNA-binding cell septation regulator SpoVG